MFIYQREIWKRTCFWKRIDGWMPILNCSYFNINDPKKKYGNHQANHWPTLHRSFWTLFQNKCLTRQNCARGPHHGDSAHAQNFAPRSFRLSKGEVEHTSSLCESWSFRYLKKTHSRIRSHLRNYATTRTRFIQKSSVPSDICCTSWDQPMGRKDHPFFCSVKSRDYLFNVYVCK